MFISLITLSNVNWSFCVFVKLNIKEIENFKLFKSCLKQLGTCFKLVLLRKSKDWCK